MVFSSLSFLCVFLPVVFLGHLLCRPLALRNALLIAASLVFYAYGEPVYVLLMVASCLANYVFALAIGRGAGRRRWALALAVVANLGMLGVFKYADMLVGIVDGAFGLALPLPELALPLGISFYTFQALSYVIDVWRGGVEASRRFTDVLLYISFFPQLIAGPIVKYHDIDEQIRDRRVTAEGAALGLRRFCFGLAKKVLIANQCAVAVDYLFAQDPASLNVIAGWTAAIAYTLQIYFDFSGYSDMAIGLGHLFGFTIPENFRYPYVATSIQGFWRRWHISLSTWFLEYLYIPLGGNRRGRRRTVLNKLCVFFLCGLWHGASWTFVAWGLIHGLFLMLEEYLPLRRLPKALGHLYALLVVCLAFVLFRASTFAQAGGVIASMFGGWDFSAEAMVVALHPLDPLFLTAVAAGVAASLPIRDWLAERVRDPATYRTGDRVEAELTAGDLAGEGSVRAIGGRAVATGAIIGSFVLSMGLLAACVLALSSGAYNPFIYFRF